MDENITNVNNEESKPAIYTTSVLMSRDLYYDFSTVGYNRMKKSLIFFLPFTVLEIAVNILAKNFDTVALSVIISLIFFLLYHGINKSTKIDYERTLISAGKEISTSYELFEDRVVTDSEGVKREYFYYQITKFFETKNFLLLHLQHNLYITINKNNLNANVDEVKNFIIQKCPLVKKKKFINCSNDKKWTLRLLILLVVFSVIGTIISLIIKFNAIF